ncbi:MAG: carbohydrate kinase family protein [Melioribacteraceae bacterium]|nr:carbohydrate kinase family protein [Melioribacteraceae bacterium]
MKLLIVGHSVVDHVFDGYGEKISPGGIFYSASGFNALSSQNDELHLLTSISDNDFHFFERTFRKYDLMYANKLEEIPHVNLYLDGNAERKEHYKKSFEPLQLSKELNLQSYDGIYINMITGTDLLPDDFEHIRKASLGKVYLDVHTLSRGIGKDQHRYFRKISDYEKYLCNVDIIQVNEHELKTVTPFDEKEKILNTVFSSGVEAIIITKGDNGAELFLSDGSFYSVEAIKVNSINKIGCGDVFGSVFFYSYLSGLNYEKCLFKANKAAGIVTTYSKANQFINLKNDII